MENGRSIAPRIRPGETMPVVPEGKVATRHYGRIVFVSAREEGEPYRGRSPYTERQIEELENIRRSAIDSLSGMRGFSFVRAVMEGEFKIAKSIAEGTDI